MQSGASEEKEVMGEGIGETRMKELLPEWLTTEIKTNTRKSL